MCLLTRSFLLGCLFCAAVVAQDIMRVEKVSGNPDEFDIDEISKLTFTETEMSVHHGSVSALGISTIRKIVFADKTATRGGLSGAVAAAMPGLRISSAGRNLLGVSGRTSYGTGNVAIKGFNLQGKEMFSYKAVVSADGSFSWSGEAGNTSAPMFLRVEQGGKVIGARIMMGEVR